MENLDKELELIKKYNSYLYDDVINNINYLIQNDNYSLFLKCYQIFKENNKETMRWEKSFELILNGFVNGEYVELLNNLKEKELSEVDIERLGILISNKNNTYNLEDLYDFESFSQIKYNSLKTVLQDFKFGKSLNEIKQNNSCVSRNVTSNLELLKDLIFQKTYNMNYEQVCMLLNTYGNDLKAIKGIDSNLIEMLENLNKINSINDINILKDMFDNVRLSDLDFNYSIVDQYLSSSFQSIYSQTQYKPSEETFKGYMKNGISLFEIDSEFFMNVYSLGGVFETQTQNYLKDWQERNDLFISTSYIGNRNMNTCPIKNVCYGFSSFLSNDILDAGTTNLQISDVISPLNPQSNHRNINVNKVKYFMPQEFLSESNKSQEVSENGYKWNEIGYRRFDENGNRIMPDYIVYFFDDDINQNDIVWKNSINAAEQFKIPIVVVNKKKIIEYNSQHSMKEFVPQQKIFINNNGLSSSNADVNRLFNLYMVPNNIFQSNEWEVIKERYDYDDLDPERKRFIEEEYIEYCKRKNGNYESVENVENVEWIDRGMKK